MSSNLIFHVVSKRKWQEFNQGGYYNPVGIKFDEGIHCVNANKLSEFINENYKGRRQVLLLVIDKSRLISKTEFDGEKNSVMIKGKINMDAVLDKIFIKPNKDGVFEIDVIED